MTTLRILGIPVTVDHHRHETFNTTGAIQVVAGSKSGTIRVEADDVTEVSVDVTTSGINTEWMVNEATISFDSDTNTLTVKSPFDPGNLIESLGLKWHAGITKGYAKRGRKWIQAGRGDVDIWIRVPRGSSVTTKTISGDAIVKGDVAKVKLSSVSGAMDIERSTERLEAQSVSGSLNAPFVVGGGSFQTVSGTGSIGLCGPGHLEVESVSGSVSLGVQAGLGIDVDAYSLSGEVSSEIELDSEPTSSTGAVASIKAQTLSGAVRIRRI